METMKLSLGALAWQIFNLLVLVAVFAYLCFRLVKAIRRAAKMREKDKQQELTPRTLGQTICDHRKASKMTQEFVAEALGVSRQAVSKWESGASIPSTANLLALAELFRVDAAELLRGRKEQAR